MIVALSLIIVGLFVILVSSSVSFGLWLGIIAALLWIAFVCVACRKARRP